MDDIIMDNVRDKIKKLLSQRDISRRALSKACGISTNTIDNWFSNYKNLKTINITPLSKIANYFGVSLDYLVSDGAADNYITLYNQLTRDQKEQIIAEIKKILQK